MPHARCSQRRQPALRAFFLSPEGATQKAIPMDTQAAYHELGLHPTASDAQLKASWRRLVATWHPDRNAAADAGRRMQAINKAYQHIRQVRDGHTVDPEVDSDSTDTAPPEPPRADPSAATHVRPVQLSLEEAILGCTRTLSGQVSAPCKACMATGQCVLALACGNCRGSGAVHKAALFGWLWNQEPCADCGGDGRQRAACDACQGAGQRTASYRRRVRFPAGVRAGHVLSVPAARQGDDALALELHLEIKPHPLFTLDADGVLRCDMPVNGYAWMAGRWVEVPSPDGVQQMRLHRDALVYRLRGQGFPRSVRGLRGDYLVRVQPVFPTQEDPAQQALLDLLLTRSTEALAADPSQPLGAWQHRLQGWSAQRKESPASD